RYFHVTGVQTCALPISFVGESELRCVGAEEAPWMRLEGQGERRTAVTLAHFDRRLDHGPVAEMDAVEISHRHHRAFDDVGRRGAIGRASWREWGMGRVV